ncbi:MAG: methyltransferase domain-containing protein [Bacteroidales bacterium]
MKRPIPRNDWSDRDVEAHWDKVASVYVRENERVREVHDQRFTESVQFLKLEEGRRVLNVSSRDGVATDYILRENPDCEVWNAEISAGLMKEAAGRRPDLRQVKIETYASLPFEDRFFDRVLSLETLEHAADPMAFLRELHRVSTSDALMVLSCPPATSEFPYRFYTFFFGGHGEGPHRFPPSGRVKQMLDMSGWNLLHHQGTVLIPVGPAALRRWGERIIRRYQHTAISELGIRQFYVCNKQ